MHPAIHVSEIKVALKVVVNVMVVVSRKIVESVLVVFIEGGIVEALVHGTVEGAAVRVSVVLVEHSVVIVVVVSIEIVELVESVLVKVVGVEVSGESVVVGVLIEVARRVVVLVHWAVERSVIMGVHSVVFVIPGV